MNIETKFSIGDKVFAIINDQIIKVVIKKIEIEVSEKSKIINYHLNWENTKWTEKRQSEIYHTKEDIIKDLK